MSGSKRISKAPSVGEGKRLPQKPAQNYFEGIHGCDHHQLTVGGLEAAKYDLLFLGVLA